ncbi:MAG: hypothetical protein KAI17_08780 [Thiotrichaceae bacterium]|nr:hypothetical protein [Thiotrichaceae bacterium]
MKTKQQKFIIENAENLVRQLASECASSTKEIMSVIPKSIPKNVTEDDVFKAILSMKYSIELAELGKRYGMEAVTAFAKEGISTFSKEIHPMFPSLIEAAQQTMINNPDPSEWIRVHCKNYLETKDPENELFHVAVGHSVSNVVSIEDLVEHYA